MNRILLSSLLFLGLFFGSNALASITAEEAYDIARMEMFPIDYEYKFLYIIRNETPWSFYDEGKPWHKPERMTQIEKKLEGKKYWAVVFKEGEINFEFFIDSENGNIIDSDPTLEEIQEIYSKKGIVPMDVAILMADKEIKKRNLDMDEITLKINEKSFNYIYDNYITLRPKLSELLPKRPRRMNTPVWEIIYRKKEKNKNKDKDITILIDGEKGELIRE